jgi:hypothetical protein
MMGLAILVSYFFDTVKGGWEAILSIGAGTGLVFMLRWFWWRINAWSEITAMLVAGIASFAAPELGYEGFAATMIFTTSVTTAAWLAVTLLTPAESEETLQEFFDQVRPGGPGWRRFTSDGKPVESLWPGVLKVFVCAAAIIGFLYGMGQLFFGLAYFGIALMSVAVVIIVGVVRRLVRQQV